MISCSEAVQRLWDYLENDVAAPERSRVDQHLAYCRRCCGELEFAEQLRTVLADAAATPLPSDVEDRLTGALDDLVDAAGAPGVDQRDRADTPSNLDRNGERE